MSVSESLLALPDAAPAAWAAELEILRGAQAEPQPLALPRPEDVRPQAEPAESEEQREPFVAFESRSIRRLAWRCGKDRSLS
jgi:hypothetical protein